MPKKWNRFVKLILESQPDDGRVAIRNKKKSKNMRLPGCKWNLGVGPHFHQNSGHKPCKIWERTVSVRFLSTLQDAGYLNLSVRWHMPLGQNPHTDERSIRCMTKKSYGWNRTRGSLVKWLCIRNTIPPCMQQPFPNIVAFLKRCVALFPNFKENSRMYIYAILCMHWMISELIAFL